MTQPSRGHVGTLLRRHPSGVLLAVQLLGVLLYPFMEQAAGGAVRVGGVVAFELFGALVLTLAVWSVRSAAGRTSTVIAIGLGVVASAMSITEAIHHVPGLPLLSPLLHAVFYFWAAGNLMVYMLADFRVTTDELYAVGATFTLVAWGFAYLYRIVQLFQPGCFTAAVAPEAPRTWVELLFLSFTTLSSTGLSDVVPITGPARAVVMIEQLAGLGYVALFVSRLVGIQISRQMSHADTSAGKPADEDSTR